MSPSLPLEGVKVVEAGIALAGPFCGSLLADQGARVVKVERPDGGDPARLIGPTMEGHALWWGVASRDKLCVSLNLKDAGDRDRLLDLIAEADVFVENYRPGVLERLGLGWDTLVARNPRLVGMSISGFGQSGPYAGRPGFGKIAECFSGIVPVTGAPQDPPLHVGFSLADTSAGLMGAMAINMALYRCDCGGGGAVRIDVGLYEPLFRMMETQFALLAATGAAPIRQGTNDPYGWGAPDATNRRFVPVTCRDGAEVLVLMDEDAAGGIAALAGADDEAGLRSWAATVDVGEAAEAMRRHGIEAARIHDGQSMAREPYFRERGDVLDATAPNLPPLAVPGQVPRCPTPARRAFRDTAIGEDNEIVFGEAARTTESTA